MRIDELKTKVKDKQSSLSKAVEKERNDEKSK